MNDIIIWYCSIKEYKANIQQVLQTLWKVHLYCSSKKTDLFIVEIHFLEHIISNKGIQADLSKINKILDWPTPKASSEVQRFLGLIQYLVTFISHLAEHTGVLNTLIKKAYDQKFPEWTLEH